MRALAFHPQESEIRYFERMPPLGMLWVAGALGKAGHEIVFIDQQVDDREPGDVASRQRPGIALIGGTSHCRFTSFAAASLIKERSPRTCVVYGGPHASFTAEDTLANVPSIDVIVHGEGEETAVQLAGWVEEGRDPARLAAIRGISYRDFERIRRTQDRPHIEDLDALGAPPRELVPVPSYGMRMEYLGVPGTSILTARGCPIACTFCSASAMFGPSYRMRSARNVVDEIEDLVARYGIQGMKIFDSTFTLQARHVEEFCDELLRRKLRLRWECEVRVGSVDRLLLERMRDAGCYYIDVGVESGSQRVLDECIGKKTRLPQATEMLRWAHELRILTKVFLTVGHPGETPREAAETNRFFSRHRRWIRLVGFGAGVRIYPGTAVERYAREHGLMPPGFRWSAPYRNEANRKLFRPVDEIPILLQPGFGVAELRRVRLTFIGLRLMSPRFVAEKLARILRARAIARTAGVLLSGLAVRPTPVRPAEPSAPRTVRRKS